MATLKQRLPENATGEFYVDATCIDCGTCRLLAPKSFAEGPNASYVAAQPGTPEDERKAMQALLACPTGSIGTLHPHPAREVMGDFPMLLDEGIYYNGFNSPKSYGGHSYFVHDPHGNWLIDSPKFLPHLVQRFEAMGGIRTIFLTHQDDVAEAARYAERFGSERIIHQADLSAQPNAERVLSGGEPTVIAPGYVAIPTPGHTRGSMVLLVRDRFLFAGDHLWGTNTGTLGASRGVCWYSWSEQTRSMQRLLDYRFEWVLPGHGNWLHLPPEQMHAALCQLVERMKQHA
ncbi:Hydroxyacylglutathione hydrolase [compost metagenome]